MKVTFVHYLEEMLRFINLLQSSNNSIQKAAQELNAHCDVIEHKASSVAGHVDVLFEKAASLSPQTKELAI